jgi:diguanylate cyclase (GGDEF)-like protein
VDPAPSAPGDDVTAAIRAIWARRRPEVLARVDVIEDAVAALLADALGHDLREQARREAHKVAGSAGTFGYPRSSALARELERAFEPGGAELAAAARLAEHVLAIRAELAGEGAPDAPSGAGEHAQPLVLIAGGDRARSRALAAEAHGRGLRTRAVGLDDAVAEAAAHHAAAVLLDAADAPADTALQAIRAMSSSERTEAPVPLLVLAGSGTLQHRVELARAGARRVLPATLPAERIVETLLTLLAEVRAAQPVVVALDDDPAILLVLEAMLRGGGITTVPTADADAFWHRIRADRPDMVVLDLDMPGVDGIEMCRVIRNEADLADLPVLFLTGHSDAESLHRIFTAGADDFVGKPVVPAVLLTRVRNRLERVRLHAELTERDQLTGLTNRVFAVNALNRMIGLARAADDAMSLAIVDVDRFKRINDRFGHAAGDRVLRGVADVLRVTFRAEDVVARWGGEEFAVGLYGTEADVAAQRLEQALERLRAEGVPGAAEAGRGVTFSAGVAELGRHGDDLESLYRAADDALYRAKTGGRDRVAAATSGGQPVEHVDVAIVEDDGALAEVLLHALETAGLTARAIDDGVEARRLLAGADPLVVARVVVLDVDLPGLDGLALLRALARDGVLRRSRAVMLTARATEAETLTALQLGAVDHVAKPFSVPILMQRIRLALDA